MSQVLQDKTPKGKERPWRYKKVGSLNIGAAFFRLGEETRAKRLEDCGNYLLFKSCPDNHSKTLKKAFFCKNRLCPMCAWRKSRLNASNVAKIVNSIAEDKPTYKYLFVTLTVPNVSGEDLPATITRLQKSWAKLIRRKNVKKVWKGYFRSIETTYNTKRGDFHPHIHAIVLVPAGYFKKNYITRNKYLEMWQECYQDYDITQVDVRKCYDKNEGSKGKNIYSAIAEASKYIVDFKWMKAVPAPITIMKNGDKIFRSGKDLDLFTQVVSYLHEATKGRRLHVFGGEMLEVQKQLNLKDSEDATTEDLIKVGEELTGNQCPTCNKKLIDFEYLFKQDHLQYYEIEKKPKRVIIDRNYAVQTSF